MDSNQDDAPATKSDIKALLSMVATKDDLLAVRGDLASVQDELQATRRTLALQIVETGFQSDKKIEKLRDELNSKASDIVTKIDGFMSEVGKVDRAQIIADWRVAQLETRVDKIETRPS
jgi:hypothetical protein